MLPTPSTDHLSFDNIYEPAEDSFLLLDTLSSAPERDFLHKRLESDDNKRDIHSRYNYTEKLVTSGLRNDVPLIVEIGTGSGVILAFVSAHAEHIFGRNNVMTLGVDINHFACKATAQTVEKAIVGQKSSSNGAGEKGNNESKTGDTALFLDAINGDLTTALRDGCVDVLIFNPPYVPSEALPDLTKHAFYNDEKPKPSFEQDSYLISLSTDGGTDGMEVTNKLLQELPTILHPRRGVAYILLCAQNKPDIVKQAIREWGDEWRVETVGSSGKKAGWEKLQIVRIWTEGGGDVT